MKKGLIILPVAVFAMVAPTDENFYNFITGGSTNVHIIYQAGDGAFSDGSTIKTFQVRRGIKWDRRNNREKPLEDLVPEDEQVEFNGVWLYEDKELSDTTNNFTISEDMVVTAKYDVATPESFNTDSWYLIAQLSAQGLDKLKTTYNKTTFIGEKRTIKLAGESYTVTVIGENADPTKINELGQFDDLAPLTFQFDELIDPIAFASIDEVSNQYTMSNLRRALNKDIFDLIEKGARNNIRQVYKRTNIGGGSSAGQLDVSKEKIFALSLKEMNADSYITDPDPDIPFPHNIENEEITTNGYAYYHTSTLPDLKKHLLNESEYQTYWTRSPEIDSTNFVWQIASDGKIGVYDDGYEEQAPEDVITSLAVAPCFAY